MVNARILQKGRGGAARKIAHELTFTHFQTILLINATVLKREGNLKQNWMDNE
jgi:shikimate 5-dehydrogenase